MAQIIKQTLVLPMRSARSLSSLEQSPLPSPKTKATKRAKEQQWSENFNVSPLSKQTI